MGEAQHGDQSADHHPEADPARRLGGAAAEQDEQARAGEQHRQPSAHEGHPGGDGLGRGAHLAGAIDLLRGVARPREEVKAQAVGARVDEGQGQPDDDEQAHEGAGVEHQRAPPRPAAAVHEESEGREADPAQHDRDLGRLRPGRPDREEGQQPERDGPVEGLRRSRATREPVRARPRTQPRVAVGLSCQ